MHDYPLQTVSDCAFTMSSVASLGNDHMAIMWMGVAGCDAFDKARRLCKDAEQAMASYHIHVRCWTRESLMDSAGVRAAAAWDKLGHHLHKAQTNGKPSDLSDWTWIMSESQNIRLQFFNCHQLLDTHRMINADKGRSQPPAAMPHAQAANGLACEDSVPACTPASSGHPSAEAVLEASTAASRPDMASHPLPALSRRTPAGLTSAPLQAHQDDAGRSREPAPDWAEVYELTQGPVRRALEMQGHPKSGIQSILSDLLAFGPAAYVRLNNEAMMLAAAEMFPPTQFDSSNLKPTNSPPDSEGSHDPANDPNLIVWDPYTDAVAWVIPSVHLDPQILLNSFVDIYPHATVYIETDCHGDDGYGEHRQSLLAELDIAGLEQFALAGINDILACAVCDDVERQASSGKGGVDVAMTPFGICSSRLVYRRQIAPDCLLGCVQIHRLRAEHCVTPLLFQLASRLGQVLVPRSIISVSQESQDRGSVPTIAVDDAACSQPQAAATQPQAAVAARDAATSRLESTTEDGIGCSGSPATTACTGAGPTVDGMTSSQLQPAATRPKSAAVGSQAEPRSLSGNGLMNSRPSSVIPVARPDPDAPDAPGDQPHPAATQPPSAASRLPSPVTEPRTSAAEPSSAAAIDQAVGPSSAAAMAQSAGCQLGSAAISQKAASQSQRDPGVHPVVQQSKTGSEAGAAQGVEGRQLSNSPFSGVTRCQLQIHWDMHHLEGTLCCCHEASQAFLQRKRLLSRLRPSHVQRDSHMPLPNNSTWAAGRCASCKRTADGNIPTCLYEAVRIMTSSCMLLKHRWCKKR